MEDLKSYGTLTGTFCVRLGSTSRLLCHHDWSTPAYAVMLLRQAGSFWRIRSWPLAKAPRGTTTPRRPCCRRSSSSG